MVDLAQQAFSTKNYDLAAEIYDRNIKEHGPNTGLFLGLADSYARAGRLQTAFRAYANAFRCGCVKPSQLTNLVTSLVDKMGETEDVTAETKTKPDEQLFTCDVCKGIWNDPVTVACGHSFCRTCLVKTPQTCKKCASVHNSTRFSNPRTNVLLSSIVDKWFSDEVQAAKLKVKGNELFSSRKYEQAIEVYTKAFDLAPTDHLLTSNRSFAYASLNRYEEALCDAESSIRIRPVWAKGYYRKATALSGLGLHEKAAMAFLQCLALDGTVTSARTALAQTLHKVLSSHSMEDVKLARLQSVLTASIPTPFAAQSYASADGGAPFSGVNDDLLEQIKVRLRETLVQRGLVPGVTQQQNQPGESSPSMFTQTDRIRGTLQCHSAPNSRPGSPKTLVRTGSFTSMSQECESRLTRKRSSNDISRDHDTPMTLCNDMHTESCSHKKAARSSPKGKQRRRVAPELLHKEDFECSLCYRLLYNPVTTPCGHSYCRQCLDRSLDHHSTCPLCKSSLVEYLAERRQATTEAIELVIQTYFPEDFEERKVIHEEELADLARMDSDQIEIPIFVCTLGYPTITCPLHIFEPRYRLMIRQCMETGTRQFGMCIPHSNDDNDFADIGTMLEVRNVQYFPDGRSVVDTVGGRRFKVISRGHRDGYNTAKVEFLKDKEVTDETELEELRKLLTEVHDEAGDWYTSLSGPTKQRIQKHFGDFPQLEPDQLHLDQGPAWLWWVTAIMPLEQRAQLTVLAMTSLRERLTSVRRVLAYVRRQTPR